MYKALRSFGKTYSNDPLAREASLTGRSTAELVGTYRPVNSYHLSGRTVADLQTGPKGPRPTVLSVEEEAIVITFRRRHTLLWISRLPEVEGDEPEKKGSKVT